MAILELIAAVVAAIACAGLALLARKVTRGRLPKWIVPIAAGLGLLGFAIWSEYDWFRRNTEGLPAGFEVVWQNTGASPLRPWTYLFPLTTGFIAFDRGTLVAHPANPSLRTARIYRFARWLRPQPGVMVFDCAGGRQVLLQGEAGLTAEGALTGADWSAAAVDDPMQVAACTNR